MMSWQDFILLLECKFLQFFKNIPVTDINFHINKWLIVNDEKEKKRIEDIIGTYVNWYRLKT